MSNACNSDHGLEDVQDIADALHLKVTSGITTGVLHGALCCRDRARVVRVLIGTTDYIIVGVMDQGGDAVLICRPDPRVPKGGQSNG